MTIGSFVLFLLKYNLEEVIELVSALQDHSGLTLRFRGLPPLEIIEEWDRQFLNGLRIAI